MGKIVLAHFPDMGYGCGMTLREYMQKKDLTPEGLAIELDCSVGAVRKWLSHDRMPRPEQLRRISAFTHGQVTANDFIKQEAA